MEDYQLAHRLHSDPDLRSRLLEGRRRFSVQEHLDLQQVQQDARQLRKKRAHDLPVQDQQGLPERLPQWRRGGEPPPAMRDITRAGTSADTIGMTIITQAPPGNPNEGMTRCCATRAGWDATPTCRIAKDWWPSSTTAAAPETGCRRAAPRPCRSCPIPWPPRQQPAQLLEILPFHGVTTCIQLKAP